MSAEGEHLRREREEGARVGRTRRVRIESVQGERARRVRKEGVQGGRAKRVRKEARRESVLVSTGQTHSSFAARCACAWWKLTSLKLKDLSHILVRNNRNSAVEVEVKVPVDTLEAQLDFHRLVTFLPQ